MSDHPEPMDPAELTPERMQQIHEEAIAAYGAEQVERMENLAHRQSRIIEAQIQRQVEQYVDRVLKDVIRDFSIATTEEIKRAFADHLSNDHPLGDLAGLVDTAVAERFERYSEIFTGLHRFERMDAKLDHVVATQYDALRTLVNESVDGRFAKYVQTLHEQIGVEGPHTQATIDAAIDATLEEFATGEEAEAAS